MGALVSRSKRNQPHGDTPAAVLLLRKTNGTLGEASGQSSIPDASCRPHCASFSTCSLVALATLARPHL